LNRTNWNRKAAAKLLNVSYKSLLYRMKVLSIGSR
jgi:transcriptional regulator with PAS, ATPase and Fis domain